MLPTFLGLANLNCHLGSLSLHASFLNWMVLVGSAVH